MLSRVIHGARTALVGPAVIAAGAFAVAVVLGLLAGYLGGVVDTVAMRWADFMMALPGMLVAIVIVGVTGGGYWSAVLVLVVFFTATDTRIVRGAAIEHRTMPYIEAARSMGVTVPRILFVHILPNVLPMVIAYVLLDFAFALINLAGLSFLGLGVEPGTPDWGRMLSENRNILFTNPVALLLPAAMIIADRGQHKPDRRLACRAAGAVNAAPLLRSAAFRSRPLVMDQRRPITAGTDLDVGGARPSPSSANPAPASRSPPRRSRGCCRGA